MHVFYMILLSKLFPQKTENKWERGHIKRTISKDLCIIVFCGSLMPTYLWALSATSFQRSDEHCLNLAAATNRNWRKSFTRSKGIAPIDENLSSFLQKMWIIWLKMQNDHWLAALSFKMTNLLKWQFCKRCSLTTYDNIIWSLFCTIFNQYYNQKVVPCFRTHNSSYHDHRLP